MYQAASSTCCNFGLVGCHKASDMFSEQSLRLSLQLIRFTEKKWETKARQWGVTTTFQKKLINTKALPWVTRHGFERSVLGSNESGKYKTWKRSRYTTNSKDLPHCVVNNVALPGSISIWTDGKWTNNWQLMKCYNNKRSGAHSNVHCSLPDKKMQVRSLTATSAFGSVGRRKTKARPMLSDMMSGSSSR